jgi:MFS transporter, DHA1 family, staphyloferrin A biosynthesis exporter
MRVEISLARAHPAYSPGGASLAQVQTTLVSGEDPAVPIHTGFFAALRYRPFLMLWITHMSSSTSFWMEMVARPWLVYLMTGDPLQLGGIQAVRGAPVLLFSGIGGILADRLDRNILYIATKVINAVSLVLTTGLFFTGHLDILGLYLLTLVAGIANAMEFPIRQSIVPSLVPSHVLLNALAITQVGRQLTHVLCPAIAGVIISVFGIGVCYAVLCTLAIVTAALPNLINAPAGSRAASNQSILQNIGSAIGYVRHNEIVLALVLLATAPNFLIRSWQPQLAVFANEIHHVGEVGFGLMNTAIGVGALLGAVIIASMGSVRHKGSILLAGLGLQSLGLVLFALTPWFPLSLLVLGLMGLVQTAYFSMNNALLLSNVDEEYRGRVLSLYETDRGLIPLGAVLLGWLATVIGTPMAIAVLAAPMIPLSLLVLVLVPRFRDAA